MHLPLAALIIASAFAGYVDASRYINTASIACGTLSFFLGSNSVSRRSSTGSRYDNSTASPWNYFNSVQRPECIISPRSATQVQAAMLAIYMSGSNYSVRAGGHSAMLGWNSVDKGVLIEFSNMREAKYDAKKDTITLQPGIHWDEAITALEPFGVAPVGGRIGDVGTGLLLGGGLSFLSPNHGFAADSFKELDVVLVSGEMVTATATNEYSDLFRALKGGGNRFGIVVRYELYPVHTGNNTVKSWYGGTLMFANTSAIAVMEATSNFVTDVKDPKATTLVTFGHVVNNGSINAHVMVNAFYEGGETGFRAAFSKYLAIPAMPGVLVGPLSYQEVSNAFGEGAGSERGRGSHYGGSALSGLNATYVDAYHHWNTFVEANTDVLLDSVLAFTPIRQRQIDIGKERGGNAIDPPSGGYAAVQLAFTFLPGVSTIPAAFEESIYSDLFARIPPSSGLPLFLNEIGRKQNAFATYGGYEVLKQTYAKYDPTRFNMRKTDGPIGL